MSELQHLTPAEVRKREKRHRDVQVYLQEQLSWRVRAMARESKSEFARTIRELERAEGFERSIRFQEPR